MESNIIWKIIKAGKWSAIHYKAFIVGLIILIGIILVSFIAYHGFQCNKGKHDKLTIKILFFEHECNNCEGDSVNNSITNNGTIGIASNGSGKVDASNITIVESNTSVPSLLLTKEFEMDFNETFKSLSSIDAFYGVHQTSIEFKNAKFLMDGLKSRYNKPPDRIIYSLPSTWNKPKDKPYIIVFENSVEIIKP